MTGPVDGLGEDIHDECTDDIRGAQSRSQQDYTARTGKAATEHEFAKIFVKGDEHSIVLLSEGENDFIVGTGLEFDHPGDIETVCACGENGFARGVFVSEEAGHLPVMKKDDASQPGIG